MEIGHGRQSQIWRPSNSRLRKGRKQNFFIGTRWKRGVSLTKLKRTGWITGMNLCSTMSHRTPGPAGLSLLYRTGNPGRFRIRGGTASYSHRTSASQSHFNDRKLARHQEVEQEPVSVPRQLTFLATTRQPSP